MRIVGLNRIICVDRSLFVIYIC